MALDNLGPFLVLPMLDNIKSGKFCITQGLLVRKCRHLYRSFHRANFGLRCLIFYLYCIGYCLPICFGLVHSSHLHVCVFLGLDASFFLLLFGCYAIVLTVSLIVGGVYGVDDSEQIKE